jgi:hypothetical protein
MNNNKLPNISFERITGAKYQQDVLYELLKKRKHNISHKSVPSKYEHNRFIKSHPYRAWYLIHNNNRCIGATYLQKNNCIGINIINNDFEILISVLKFIFKHHKPLKEIKSERPPNFYINVAPNNIKMRSQLNLIGAKKIQITYALDSEL